MPVQNRPSKTRMLKTHLLREMSEQRIPIGGRLPSESQLIERFSVSRTTVRQVLTELSSEGLVERQQGRGTFRTARGTQTSPAAGSTMLVGVWFNWPSGPLFGPISEGIRDELHKWGYHAVFEAGGFQSDTEHRAIESLVCKGLDGFIVSPSVNPGDQHGPLIELLHRKVPLVLVDNALAEFECDLVTVHSQRGAEQVVEHLVTLGHRRIGFIGLPGISTVQERLEGYRRVMRRHGLVIHDEWIQINRKVGVDTGQEAASTLLSLPPEIRPTAVFGVNDWIGLMIAQEARARGLRIPEDLSVAGFDDAHVHLSPNEPEWLTTYAQPAYHIGQEAADLLMKRIKDPGRRCTTILLEGYLIKRTSTAPPPRSAGNDGENLAFPAPAAMEGAGDGRGAEFGEVISRADSRHSA